MTAYASGPLRRRFSWTLVLVSALVLIGVGVVTYWFVMQGPGQQFVSPPGSDIAEFSGEGDQTTGSFSVRGQWQVHWQNSGESFNYSIRGDDDLGTVIEQEGPGSGVTSVVAAGTFHLEVIAEGPWEVRITQGE